RLKLALSARRLHGVEIDTGRLHRTIGRKMQRVDEMDFRLRETMRGAVDRRKRALDSVASRLASGDVRLRLAEQRRRLETFEHLIGHTVRLRLSRAARDLTPLEAHLKQLSPVKILERGYAIVEREGRLVKSPAEAPVGSDVRVRLAEGELRARVTRH